MMKIAFLACCLLLLTQVASAQYYLRGEVRNERGAMLEGVRIYLGNKTGAPYYSGNTGAFGIPSTKVLDTLFLQMDGYESFQQLVDTRKIQTLTLKMLPATANLYKHKLNSFTKNLNNNYSNSGLVGESYSSQVENEFVDANQYHQTGFALNIDHASYSNIRRFIHNQMTVPVDAVRIEEMLNYFNFPLDTGVAARDSFLCKTAVTSCPWNEKNKLFFVQVAAPRLNLDSIKASNLVFLIDISGSMDKANRLPLLQQAFKLLVENLRAKDTVSLVTYGGNVSIRLNGVSGAEKKRIQDAIDSLDAGGDTPGGDAIRTAYSLAKRTFIPEGNNRVILATDGDFNVGEATEKAMEDLISQYRQTGIYLTCLGVGMGNYKDSKLELLAKKGNGNFAYLDHLQEAQKTLVTELTQTLYTVANDAFVDIDFNPEIVKSYRLIGFDNKKNALEDSTTQLQGGEVGSGHNLMAVFEIEPRDSSISKGKLGNLNINFKKTDTLTFQQQYFEIPYAPIILQSADQAYRFATAVCMFGAMLKQSAYAKKISFDQIWSLASMSYKSDDRYQKEFVSLVDAAKQIYSPEKRKRKRKTQDQGPAF
jgi:Ca-activated chloride channel family protein